MNATLSNTFWRFFNIRPDESLLVLGFFLYYLCIGIFVIMAATVSDSLFFTHVAPGKLNALYAWGRIGIAVTTILLIWLYNHLVWRIPRVTLLLGIHGFLFCSIIGFRQLLVFSPDHVDEWVYFGLLMWLKVCSRLLIMMFFSFAGDYFTTRDAKRLYGYIAGGLTLGVIVAGLTIESVVTLIGTANMLYICGGLLGAGIGCVLVINAIGTPVARFASSGVSSKTGTSDWMKSQGYLRLVFLIVVISVICFVLVEFQMKIVARDTYPQSNDLALFFGRFYLSTGLATMLFQFFLARVLLQKLGTITCLIFLPGMYAVMSALFYTTTAYGVFPSAALMILVTTNFARIILSDAVDSPSREMLLLPLPPHLRLQAHAMMSGMMTATGQIVGGLLILSFTFLEIPLFQYSLMVCGSALGWIGFLWLLRSRYQNMLVESLQTTHLDAADLRELGQDRSLDFALKTLLHSREEHLVEFALHMLRDRSLGEFVSEIQVIARWPQPTLATKALELLGRDGRDEHLPVLEQALNSPSARIRKAAVLAIYHMQPEAALDRLDQWLHSPDPFLYEAALAGAGKYAGEIGKSRIEPFLHQLGTSAHSEDREKAARLLAEMGQTVDEDLLLNLLDDDTLAVQSAAVESCGILQVSRAIPRLLALLTNYSLRSPALKALKRMPEEATGLIVQTLDQSELNQTIREMLFQVLAAIGGNTAYQVLWEHFCSHGPVVSRIAAGQELQALTLKGKSPAIKPPDFLQKVQEFSENIRLLNRACQYLNQPDNVFWQLLYDQAQLEVECLFLLLSYRYGVRQLGQIHYNFSSSTGAQHANALELLDDLLPRRLAASVVGVLEDFSRPTSVESPELSSEALRDVCQREPWVRAMSVYFTKNVPDSAVNKLTPYERDLYNHIPDVAFLKKALLFEHVPGNYLVALACMAQPISLCAGAILFAQGDPGNAMYLICQGSIQVMVGKQEIIRRGKGECIGEMSLLDNAPRSASCVAVEDTELLMLQANDIEPFLLNQSSVALALIRTLAAMLRRQTLHAVHPADRVHKMAQPKPHNMHAPNTSLAREHYRDVSTPPPEEDGSSLIYHLMKRLAFFKRVPLFQGIPDEYLLALSELIHPISLQAGDFLCEEGEPGEALYILQRGTISVRVKGVEVNRLVEGECIGEMALLDQAPRSASCVACEETDVLEIAASDFETVLRSQPSVALAILRTLAARLRYQTVRITSESTGTP